MTDRSATVRASDIRLAIAIVAAQTATKPFPKGTAGRLALFTPDERSRSRLALAYLLHETVACIRTDPVPPEAGRVTAPPFVAMNRLYAYLDRTLGDEQICEQVATAIRAALVAQTTCDPVLFDSLCGTTEATAEATTTALVAALVILIDQIAAPLHKSPYEWLQHFAMNREISTLGALS